MGSRGKGFTHYESHNRVILLLLKTNNELRWPVLYNHLGYIRFCKQILNQWCPGIFEDATVPWLKDLESYCFPVILSTLENTKENYCKEKIGECT